MNNYDVTNRKLYLSACNSLHNTHRTRKELRIILWRLLEEGMVCFSWFLEQNCLVLPKFLTNLEGKRVERLLCFVISSFYLSLFPGYFAVCFVFIELFLLFPFGEKARSLGSFLFFDFYTHAW